MAKIDTKSKIGLWLLTLVPIGFALVDTRGGYIHWKEEIEWTHHAMFHAVTSVMYTQILAIVAVIIVWKSMAKGQRWGWWGLLVIGVGIHGGHVIADIMTHGGLRGGGTAQGPGIIFYSATLGALGLYLVGLALTWKHTCERDAPSAGDD